MNSDGTYRHISHWRSTLTVMTACLAWWRAVPFAPAQETESLTLLASLSVSPIQVAPIPSSIRERLAQQALQPTGRADWRITAPRRALTDSEAWGKFESEYRPEQRSPSSVSRQIETAKYALDSTLFAIDRFVKNIAPPTDFPSDQNSPQRQLANSRGGFWDHPRVKLDLDLTNGKPYIGARLVIPFGN